MSSMLTASTPEPARKATDARPRVPELLAPAGDWECARAAVENGADAIYFGLEKFNARMRAQNFTEADLPGLMAFLHRRGVKGYVTFNTLVFQNEIADAEQFARAMIAAGVDAAVVQDVGICRLIRSLSSNFPIHGSTQMTVTSLAGVEFARALGCNLVVLARECSIPEIGAIAAGASGSALPPLPVEVFVHGALCVAYSGQCLTSEALGGRSANRGECAQACRMPYDLIADGQRVDLGDRKYLLSPQDLAGLAILPELAQAGVTSLKIEGRLKSPEYVANITRIYREALDSLAARLAARSDLLDRPEADANVSLIPSPLRQGAPSAGGVEQGRLGSTATDTSEYEMEMAFSRGLYTGWFQGTNNQKLVHARFGKKRGVYLGQVASKHSEGVIVRLEGPLKPGDGIVFDAGKPEEPEEGGRVYAIKPLSGTRPPPPLSDQTNPGGTALLTFGHGDLDFHRVNVGDRLWKTSDPELERRLRQSFAGDTPRFPRPLDLEVHGRVGLPLTVIARDGAGHTARVDSAMPLATAEKQPLTSERLREQLGRLGGTAFKLGELTNASSGNVLLPISELNRLRRELVRQMDLLRAQPQRWKTAGTRLPEAALERRGGEEPSPSPAGLAILVRSVEQLEAALESGVKTLYCEFEDPKRYREAVRRFRASAPRGAGSAIYAAPPRIFKRGEDWVLKQVRSCEADGYLVRNYDHLAYFASDRCIGDYSLNIANRLTADYFKNQFHLERVTASYDLNFAQLEALLQAAPPEWFEVTVHQHIPMFHMEHCVFCAFLSNGTDYTNCGRPCDRHDLKLRDRVGAEHPVKADAGCRNTVFNSLAQTGADYVAQMLELGVRHFRLEFLNETPEMVRQTVLRYRQLLRGEITGQQVWRELKLLNQLGVTRGQIAGLRSS